MKCPCGDPHTGDWRWELVERITERYGATLQARLLLDGPAWEVPRAWIAFHGLNARELPELAARYHWPEVG